MKRISISIIFLLISILSFSQTSFKTNLAFGFSGKGELFITNKFSNPFSTPIGIFAQYHFTKRFSLFTSYYYSRRHFKFEERNNPNANFSLTQVSLKEDSFRSEHLLKFYFYKKKLNYFVGLGTSLRVILKNRKNTIMEFQVSNSQSAIISTSQDQTYKRRTKLRGYNLLFGVDYPLPNRLFFSMHLGINSFGKESYFVVNKIEIANRNNFKNEINYILKLNLGWYFTN